MRRQKNVTVIDSRRHVFIVFLVFMITFVVTKYNPFIAARFQISDPTAVQFHSVVAQSLAGLLALLITFMLFSLQGADQRLMGADQKLRSELRQLSLVAGTCPARLRAIRDDLKEIVAVYSSLGVQELSPGSSSRPAWDAVLEDFAQDYAALGEAPPRAIRPYLDQIVFCLKGIEEALNEIGMQFIAMVITQVLVSTIISFAFLLGVSLVAVLVFGTIPVGKLCPALANAITVALLCWTLLTLLQLARHTSDIYRDTTEQMINPSSR
jgi:hypothetical protein